MHAQKVITWVLVFSALASSSYYALQPHGGTKEVLAAATTKKQVALVLSHEEVHSNIIRRLIQRLNRKNLVCTIDASQAAYLSEHYETETETVSVKGEELTVFKIKKEQPRTNSAIRRYLRESGNEHCVVIPARNWYYTVLGGSVS